MPDQRTACAATQGINIAEALVRLTKQMKALIIAYFHFCSSLIYFLFFVQLYILTMDDKYNTYLILKSTRVI